jgi:hypothetical protein
MSVFFSRDKTLVMTAIAPLVTTDVRLHFTELIHNPGFHRIDTQSMRLIIELTLAERILNSLLFYIKDQNCGIHYRKYY